MTEDMTTSLCPELTALHSHDRGLNKGHDLLCSLLMTCTAHLKGRENPHKFTAVPTKPSTWVQEASNLCCSVPVS